MELTNNIHVYCKSMGKLFRVSYIAKTTEDANKFMKNHNDCGVIAEDKNGLIYIAELYSLTVPSGFIPD
jgi:UDP-N-acetylglucosamine pyrophosphorylase